MPMSFWLRVINPYHTIYFIYILSYPLRFLVEKG